MHLRRNTARKQRGITFIGFLFVAVIVGFLMIVAAKTVPSVIEYQAIVKAVKKAKDHETVADIERSFEAAAAIDDITSIRGEDLVITKENGQTVIMFNYDKEITLMGPVSLLIHYSGSSR